MSFGQYSAHPRPSKPIFRSDVNVTQKAPKRLKHVFDNPAHVWAHPLQKDGSGFEQDNARNAQSNFYFKTSPDGTRVMYSYRDSYPIASRFEQGRKIIFLLRAGSAYSVTTAKHFSQTRQSVPRNDENVFVFTVPEMVEGYGHSKPGQNEHAKNVANYLAEIADAIERHSKARSSHNVRGTLNEAASLTAEIKKYGKTFKVKLPALPKLPKLDAAKLADTIKREQVREAKQTAKRAAERAAWEAQHAAEVQAWKDGPQACKHLDSTGEPVHSFSDRWTCERQTEREDWQAHKVERIAAWKRGESVQLRMDYGETALLRVKDGNVQTSQSVDVPITGRAGAARLFRFLLKLKETGQTFQTNGHREPIGNFNVTSFDGLTLVAGCHRISWESILEISAEVLAVEQAAQGDTQQA
jgi:hypothetical protein